MSVDTIRALTFDTGGTILDWHGGFVAALADAGKRHGVVRDWAQLANELRRRSLKAMLNQGESAPPAYTIDGAHRSALEALLAENDLSGVFTPADLHAIAYQAPHSFKCWSDFPEVLPKLRKKLMVVSFTILSYRLIIDTARANGLSWDAVFSCEGIGKYKLLPEAYRAVARYLQLEPHECCMVACHNFDLDAAKAIGFKTAFVRRPDEWGPAGPPDPEPNPAHDIIVDSFPELAVRLGASQ
jgi:2-haloacid dehalogenase